MTALVTCPNPSCGRPTPVPEERLGRAVRCPHCRRLFIAAPSTNAAAGETLGPNPTQADAELPRQVGRFQVRARLGSGAFGAVYRAFDPQLDREVALKVPQAGVLDNPQARERFLREARAAARLRHPHIVPVFQAGADDSRPYIASAYVEGQTLAQAQERQPANARQAARIVRDLAEALAYAHEQGIVHRDVKPANIMLDARGQPHLMDFGLAHFREESSQLTQDGSIVGTPAYMAPEQARGRTGKPLPASDQYALGVVLYELLTGQTPFSGPPQVVLFNVLHTDPKPPRRLNPRIPRDLETVCLKALARRPEDRYPDCQELADDLRRWLEDEPVHARPLGPAERLGRWCRREPLLAGLTALAAVGLLAVAGVASWSAYQLAGSKEQVAQDRARAERKAAAAREYVRVAREQAERAKREEEQARQAQAEAKRRAEEEERVSKQVEAEAERARRAKAEADRAEEEGRRQLYQAHLKLVTLALTRGQLRRAAELLDRQAPGPDQKDLRGPEWRYLRAFIRGPRHLRPRGEVFRLAWSREGRFLVTASDISSDKGEKTELRVWDVFSGREKGSLSLEAKYRPWGLAVSGDGKQVALGHARLEKIGVWDLPSGRNRLVIPYPTPRDGDFLAFTPGCKALIVGRSPEGVEVWDLATGRKTRKFELTSDSPIALSPDGKTLATAAALWDLETGKARITFPKEERPTCCLDFSPDGKTLARWLQDSGLEVWDLTSGKVKSRLQKFRESLEDLVITPDGKYLVGVGRNREVHESGPCGGVKIWDLGRGQEILTIPVPVASGEQWSLAPNGRALAAWQGGSGEKTDLKLWVFWPDG